MDDRGIVELYWQRSDQAIIETSAKYGAYCLKVSTNILSDILDSQENVNDTYLRAWNAMPPHRPESLAPFLGKIARNLALNRYKARRTLKRGGGEFEASLEELGECIGGNRRIDEKLEVQALSDSISAFLWKQSPPARRAFVRRYFYGDTVKDIAAQLKMGQSGVKSMLARTRSKLRLYLESEGFTVGK